jgi:hypothetical protein
MYALDLESQFRDGRQSFAEAPFANDWNYEDCPLMQFTGLKDRTGKEIYEGDIVTADRIFGEESLRKERTQRQAVSQNECGFAPFNSFTSSFEKAEVIGNIYENPELLK